MKKISSHNNKYSDMEPISTYHVEYEPKLIVRGTTLRWGKQQKSGAVKIKLMYLKILL